MVSLGGQVVELEPHPPAALRGSPFGHGTGSIGIPCCVAGGVTVPTGGSKQVLSGPAIRPAGHTQLPSALRTSLAGQRCGDITQVSEGPGICPGGQLAGGNTQVVPEGPGTMPGGQHWWVDVSCPAGHGFSAGGHLWPLARSPPGHRQTPVGPMLAPIGQ